MRKENIKGLYRKHISVINITLIVVVFILSLIIFFKSPNLRVSNIISRDKSSNFILTNPILDCENSNPSNSVVFSKDIEEKVEKLKKQYSPMDVSLYFRDLNNGLWMGVNEKEVFSPASLLKTPVLISFLREVENDKSLLDEKVTITESDINKTMHQNIVFDNLLTVGKTYSLKEITESMIQKSDNTGVTVLLDYIKPDYVSDLFKSIGVPFKDTISEVDIKVKDYAGFFRVLFNASYLNREMSEMALEILSKSEYNNGLVAGVPENIKIAHKFGERSINSSTNNFQLHDCGIVYYPEKPYIICVMTKGDDFKKQEKVIQELSKYIYDEVDKSQK